MSRKALRATLVVLGTALLPLSVGQAAHAAITAKPAVSPAVGLPHLVPAGYCRKRMGPFATQDRAWAYIRMLRARGYQTSGVWGEGGSIAYSHRPRAYYFNVFYPC